MAAFLADRLLIPRAVPAVAASSPASPVDRSFCGGHDGATRERRIAAQVLWCRGGANE
jgi:hypothetical protein